MKLELCSPTWLSWGPHIVDYLQYLFKTYPLAIYDVNHRSVLGQSPPSFVGLNYQRVSMMVYYGYDVGLLERVPKRNWNSPTKLGAVEVRPPPQVGIEPLVNHRKTMGKP